MSDTIWLETTDGHEKTGGERDNSIMLKLAEELDALAEKLNVPKFSSFYDNTALADAYAGEFDDTDVPPVEPVWFEAAAGRQAVEAILAEVRRNAAAIPFPTDPTRGHWPDALRDELEYLQTSLVQAEQRGLRFHFLIVP
jgi:hypothetical protein